MSATGRLMIRTYVSNMIIPLGNVNVTVVRKDRSESHLVAFRTTNTNGKTNEIEISTPDFNESLNDQNSGERFAIVDITVEKEGYGVTLIKDVQVFADRLSEQDVEMIPLPEFSNFDEYYNVYTVTPQNL